MIIIRVPNCYSCPFFIEDKYNYKIMKVQSYCNCSNFFIVDIDVEKETHPECEWDKFKKGKISHFEKFMIDLYYNKEYEDTAIEDFLFDYKNSIDFPKKNSRKIILNYLHEKSACDGAVEAFNNIYNLYLKNKKSS